MTVKFMKFSNAKLSIIFCYVIGVLFSSMEASGSPYSEFEIEAEACRVKSEGASSSDNSDLSVFHSELQFSPRLIASLRNLDCVPPTTPRSNFMAAYNFIPTAYISRHSALIATIVAKGVHTVPASIYWELSKQIADAALMFGNELNWADLNVSDKFLPDGEIIIAHSKNQVTISHFTERYAYELSNEELFFKLISVALYYNYRALQFPKGDSAKEETNSSEKREYWVLLADPYEAHDRSFLSQPNGKAVINDMQRWVDLQINRYSALVNMSDMIPGCIEELDFLVTNQILCRATSDISFDMRSSGLFEIFMEYKILKMIWGQRNKNLSASSKSSVKEKYDTNAFEINDPELESRMYDFVSQENEMTLKKLLQQIILLQRITPTLFEYVELYTAKLSEPKVSESFKFIDVIHTGCERIVRFLKNHQEPLLAIYHERLKRFHGLYGACLSRGEEINLANLDYLFNTGFSLEQARLEEGLRKIEHMTLLYKVARLELLSEESQDVDVNKRNSKKKHKTKK